LGLFCHTDLATLRRTHPDDLLVQPAAPRQLCARIHRRVGGELEQRLEALGLAVGEHRPRPGLLTRLRLRGQPNPLVTGQLLSIC